MTLGVMTSVSDTVPEGRRSPVPGALEAAQATAALLMPTDPEFAAARGIEVAALSLLAADPAPALACPALPEPADWYTEVVVTSARVFLRLAAGDPGPAAASDRQLAAVQKSRESAFLMENADYQRPAALRIMSAYLLSTAIAALARGDLQGALKAAERGQAAADAARRVTAAVLHQEVACVAKAAPITWLPAAAPLRPAADSGRA